MTNAINGLIFFNAINGLIGANKSVSVDTNFMLIFRSFRLPLEGAAHEKTATCPYTSATV